MLQKNILTTLILFFLLGFFSLTQAAIRGDEMLRACTGNIQKVEEAGGKLFCLGYMSGFLDSYMITQEVHGNERKLFCLPPAGLTTSEAAQVIVDYLGKNPNKLEQSARSLIILAFIEKFPCKTPS